MTVHYSIVLGSSECVIVGFDVPCMMFMNKYICCRAQQDGYLVAGFCPTGKIRIKLSLFPT